MGVVTLHAKRRPNLIVPDTIHLRNKMLRTSLLKSPMKPAFINFKNKFSSISIGNVGHAYSNYF